MNSAAKQHPRSLSRLLGPWTALAALLLAALPSHGQKIYTGGAITIDDAALDTSLPPPQPSIPKAARPYGADGGKITIESPYATSLKGRVSRIAVALPNLTHGYIADLDVLLVGPGGDKVMLFSDVAVGMAAAGEVVVSSAAGSLSFPDTGAPGAVLPSGSAYRPADFENSDVLPAPAPGRPYGTDLGVFTSSDAPTTGVGEWKLYVADDRNIDSGSIAPWQLRLWFTPVLSVTNVANSVTTDEDTPVTVWVRVEDPDTSLDAITPTAVSSDTSIVTNTAAGGLVFGARNGAFIPLTITPRPNANGGPFNVRVSMNDGVTTENLDLSVTVVAKNDAPNIPSGLQRAGTNITFVSTSQGQISDPYTITLSDIDNPAAELTAYGLSNDGNVVADAEILFAPGTGATRTFFVAPKGAATTSGRAPLLRLFARDAANSNSQPFAVDLAINGVSDRRIFANTNVIAIADSVTNSTTIAVSGLTSSGVPNLVSKVTVTLANVTHARPEDIDAWVVGPQGQKVILTAAAGGSNPISRGRLIFDSSSGTTIPDNGELIPSGFFASTYAPADYRGPSSPSLNDFANTNPNGNWVVYVVDRAAGETGSVASGVVLTINTKPAFGAISDVTIDEDANPSGTPRNISFAVGDLDGTVTSVTALVTGADTTIIGTPVVTFTSGGTSGNVAIISSANKSGEVTVTLTATDNSGNTGTTSFKFKINEVNDRPTIGRIEKQITYAGQPPAPVDFEVGDVETAPGSLTITATSSNTDLLPNQNIDIAGSGSTRTIRMFPIGQNQGITDITINVIDGGGGGGALSTNRTFRLEVLPPATYVQHNPRQILFRDSGVGNGPTNAEPSTITVAGLVGSVTKIKVNLLGLRHPLPNDLDLMLVGPAGQKVLLMSDAGSTFPVENLNLMFDDSASSPLSSSSKLTSGTFQPSDYSGDPDSFTGTPTPPTAPSPNNPLSVFNGTNPNGVWTLYAMDDTGNSTGDTRVGEILGGWMLHVQTTPVLSAIDTPIAMLEDTDKEVIIDLGDPQPGIPTSFSFTANSNPGLIDTATVQFLTVDGRADQRRMILRGRSNQFGTATLSLSVSVGGSASNVRTFVIDVAAVNDAPTIAGIPDPARITTPAGLVYGPLILTLADTEGSPVTLRAASSNPALPAENIIITGSGSTRQLVIVPPSGTETLTSTITLTADDGGTRGTKDYAIAYETIRGNIFGTREQVVINDNGIATPYPSVINVPSGIVQGLVGRVRVTINQLSHNFPDDVHLLLVHGGKKVALLGNAGGGGPTNSIPGPQSTGPVTITFSDAAATAVGNQDLLTTGNFRAGDYDYSASEAAPREANGSAVPAGPYVSNLSEFNLMDPSGDWKLYAWDDTRTDAGLIAGGWTLVIDTATQIADVRTLNADGVAVGTEDEVLAVDITLADSDTSAAALRLTAALDGAGTVTTDSRIGFDSTTTNLLTRRLYITNIVNVSGNITNTILLTADDRSLPASTRSFKVKFTPVDDVPVLTTATNKVVINEDTPVTITVNMSDVDSTLDITNIVVTSSNEELLRGTTNLSYTFPSGLTPGASGTFSMTVQGRPNRNGETTLNISIRDNATRVTSTNIVLQVTPVNDAPTISNIPNYGDIRAGTNSVPVVFQVNEVESTLYGENEPKDLLVSATAFKRGTSTIADSIPATSFVLSQSGTNRTLSFSTIGTTAEDVTIVVHVIDRANPALSSNDAFDVNVLPPLRQPGITFADTTPRAIRDLANTNLSINIPVGSLAGRLWNVTVNLNAFSHTVPDDVDALLIAPDQGDGSPRRAVVILSDAGGRFAANNLFLQFRDDGKDGLVRDDGPLTNGEYIPSNYTSDADSFPTGISIVSRLQDLRGLNPNGTWSLYIADDSANDSGSLGQGWSIQIVTTPTFVIDAGAGGATTLRYAENTAGALSRGINKVVLNDVDVPGASPADYDLRFTSSDENIIPTNSVVLPKVFGSTQDVTITPNPNMFDLTTNLTVSATLTRKVDGASASISWKNLITDVNTAPELSRTVDRSTTEEIPNRDLRLTVTDFREPGDPADPSVLLVLEASSSDTSVVSNTNIQFLGSNGVLSNRVTVVKGVEVPVTIIPNANAASSGSRTTTITIVATDQHTNTVARLSSTPTTGFGRFVFTVNPKNDEPSITVADADRNQTVEAGVTRTVSFTVADPDDTTNLKVTARSLNQNVIRDSSIVVTPETGGLGARTVTFRVEPNIPPSTTQIALSIVDKNGGAGSRPGQDKFINVSSTVSREVRFEGRSATLNAGGASTPYPLTIGVDSLNGNVSKVRVEILGLAHTYPDDLDMFLVSPAGKRVWLMSDAGGANVITNLNVIFAKDDSFPLVPDADPITSRSYRPANHPDVGSDNFPNELINGSPVAVAAPASTASDLALFNGDSAKGVWKLYINDDTSGDGGSFQGWALYISTGPRIEGLTNQLVTVDEDSQFRIPFQVVDEGLVATNVKFGFASTNASVVAPSGLSVIPGEGNNFTLVGLPVLNASGSAEITVTATNDNQIATGKFRVSVTGTNDPPTITVIPANQTISSGEALQIGFNYSDPETDKKNLILDITSSDPALIPTNNVFQVGNNLIIAPVGNLTGRSRIVIRATDPQGLFDEKSFDIEVIRALQAQFANTNVISIPVSGKATPYGAPITVTGVRGLISKVTVTLAQVYHGYPADLDVLLVSPDSRDQKKVVLMSDAGGGRGVGPTRITFSDTAATNIAYNPTEPTEPGTYKPTNWEGTADLFPDVPAGSNLYPPPDGTAGLSSFRGLDPNGTWNLFVMDDVSPDSGRIDGGWILNIYTTQPVISTVPPVTRPELVDDSETGTWVPFFVSATKVNGDDNTTNLTVTASHQNVGLLGSSGTLPVRVKTGDPAANREVLIRPIRFANGEAVVTLDVSAPGESPVSSSFMVTVTPVNQAPTITGLSDQTVPSNRTLNVPFTVADNETSVSNLVVTAELERPSFGTVSVSTGGANRILTFRPTGEKGSTGARVIAFDGTSATTNSFLVTVGEPYTLRFSPIADQNIPENGQKVVPFTVLGSETGNIQVTVSIGNPSVIREVVLDGSGISWSATIRTVTGANGTSKITLSATDEFGVGTDEFEVSIVPVDDPPTIAPIADVTTFKNINAIVRTTVADNDTPLTALEFSWASSNPDLVRGILFSLVDNTLVAVVTPQRDQIGVASVTIFVNDGANKVGRPFLLRVENPPNLPPVLSAIPDQSTFVNVPAFVRLSVTDPDTEISALKIEATASNSKLVRTVISSLGTDGTAVLNVQLVRDQVGQSSIQVSVNDGATTVSRSFILTVNERPNEAPVLAAIPDQTTDVNVPLVVTLGLTDPDTAIADLTLEGSASNAGVIQSVAFSNDGAVVKATVTPVKDATGLSTVTITVKDGKNTVSRTFAVNVEATAPPQLSAPTLTRNPDGSLTVTVTWQNGGELEWASSPTGPWTKTGNKTGTYSEPATGIKYFRVTR